jgi:hypothetical protein
MAKHGLAVDLRHFPTAQHAECASVHFSQSAASCCWDSLEPRSSIRYGDVMPALMLRSETKTRARPSNCAGLALAPESVGALAAAG